MSYYISKTPNKNGNYGSIYLKPLSSNKSLKLPNHFKDLYLQAKGFVTITVDDDNKIIDIIPNDQQLNSYNEIMGPLELIGQYEEEKATLQNDLASEDYKIIKCMEAFLKQQEMPYDYSALIDQRNSKRARINELEEFINKKDEYASRVCIKK